MKQNPPQPARTDGTPVLVNDAAGIENSGPLLIPTDEEGKTAAEAASEVSSRSSNADDEDDQEAVHDLSGAAWQGWVFALLPVLICFFGAGRETWSKGLAAAGLGIVMMLFPAQKRLPRLTGLALLAVTLAPLLAFLPEHWFHASPAWRTHLTQDWGIAMSGSLTPQAAVTLEMWMTLALFMSWLWWSLSRGCSKEQRRVMLQVLGTGGVLLCLFSILEGAGWLKIPWWPRRPEWSNAFGPFANRNHISSIAAITTVLCAACAYDAHRRKSRLWACFALMLLVPVACIFTNTSRAGVVLLFLGITVWLGTSAMRRGFFKKMAVTASLVLIISTLLVVSSGGVSARFQSQGAAPLTTSQGRGAIYSKTLDMLLAAPWTGQGLGNFDAVFPQFAGAYNLMGRPIHPESDLLWLLAEGGLLTVLPGIIVLAWIFNATGPWFKRSRKRRASGGGDRRLRNAAAIVCGIGVVHGLVDVPLHEPGYFAFLALLAGISIRPRRLPLPAAWWHRASLRVAGTGACLLGLGWIATSQGRIFIPGKSAAENLRERAGQMIASGSYADALKLQNAALVQAPMSFILYFERAHSRLYLRQQPQEALADFSRARMLEPNSTNMNYEEGVIWLDFDPRYAVIGWRKFLERYPARAPGIYGYYRMMLNHAARHPELREPLWSLATSFELKLDYLEGVTTREEFERCLRSLLVQQPDLAGLEPVQRERLFQLWYERGDQTALISALETNRKWRDDSWRILAEHHAQNSNFQRACEIATPYLPSIPRTAAGASTDIPALERALLYSPLDAMRGIDLFQAQKNKGDIDGALRTLEKVITIPNAPTYVRQEIAALYIMKMDFRRAWESFREAMQKR